VIIQRYLSRQVLGSTIAVAVVLTVILMSGRIIKYFGMAADGRMDVSLLTAVLLYRLPGFLELIVPLGMFIAIMLVFGRLYMDNEMSVLSASGVSRAQIAGHLAWPVLLIAIFVAFTSLQVTPAGNAESERLFAEQAERNTFDLIKPGKFQRIGERMLYAERLSDDKTQLLGVHLFEQRSDSNGIAREIMVQAQSGRRVTEAGEAYLILEKGVRHDLAAGDAARKEIRFEMYRVLLPPPVAVEKPKRIRSYSTPEIWSKRQDNPEARGEWIWRVSMAALVPVVALLALSLSRVNPRQGRYLKLFPAILLYLSYVVAIAAVRNNVEKGKLAEGVIWAVHGGYLILALGIFNAEALRLWWLRQRSRRAVA
jgi:lipopolysaccharide export system permease protein